LIHRVLLPYSEPLDPIKRFELCLRMRIVSNIQAIQIAQNVKLSDNYFAMRLLAKLRTLAATGRTA
jgi:hypothetical protein